MDKLQRLVLERIGELISDGESLTYSLRNKSKELPATGTFVSETEFDKTVKEIQIVWIRIKDWTDALKELNNA